MTAIRMVYVQCNTEDCDSSTSDESHWSVAEARAAARALGWAYRRGRDICPTCRAGNGPYAHGDEHLTPEERQRRR